MGLFNLNNDHFSIDEINAVDRSWEIILGIFTRKTRNLSPLDRQKYGSISEANKLVVIKVLDYHRNQPHLDCPDVDYVETKADFDDRTFLAGFISRMIEVTNVCNNIRITHDYDCYQASRTDYDFTKYKMGTAPGAGFESKYNDLLPFFKTYDGQDDETPTPPTA